MSKSLGLALPERSKPDKQHFDLRPRQVDQWLSDLPRGNIGETARQVFLALVDTNRLNYPHQNRIHFLEAIRETINYVTESMRRHFISINAPLPEKNWKIAEATREIFLAQGTGYLIAIDDLLSHSFLFADTHTLAILIHRAITALGRVMLTCYHTYAPLPSGIWHKIHTLYKTAEARKIEHTLINDEHHRFVPKTSITIEYVRLLLLSLASPYRLRHGEVTRVYDILERWNSKCRLQAYIEDVESEKNASMQFVVDLASDESPRSAALTSNELSPDRGRILDTKPLANTIRKELKTGFKAGETTLTGIEMNRPDLSHDLMRRLLIAWCVLPKRGFPRSEVDEQVEVTLGLTATHQVIISGTRKNAQDTFNNTAHFDAGKIKDGINMNTPVQPDVWDMIYSSGKPEDMQELEDQFNKEQNPASDIRKSILHQPETWTILNESARGYCIHSLSRPKDARAQVGELIGIRRSIRGHTWKWGIGVIRWLKVDSQDRLMLGIEMLTPDAASVGIRGIAQTHSDYQRTLMLPQIKAINQPTTLITGPVPYRVGNQLVINILGKEIMIKLTKQALNTGLFAQFEFEIQEQNTATSETSTEKPIKEDDEFDSVWSSI